jgi:L-rhamnonate dehydratase
VRAYASALFGDTPEATSELARSFVRKGFTAVKFGWGPFGQDEGLDIDLAAAARDGLGSETDFMIDVGCAWDWRTAARREEALRPYRPFWIEEPLAADDIQGYAKLTERSLTRIAAGESEADLPSFSRLICGGGIDVVQPDVARCGGLTGAMRVAEIASFNQRQVANHAFKTGISIAASLHFLAAIPNALILEYCVSESPLRQRTTRQTFPVIDGYVDIPQEPGLGIDLDPKTIERYRCGDPVEVG